MSKLLYLCDWLPPDFGAVGQYSLQFAQKRAARGDDVLLLGFSSNEESLEVEEHSKGRLRVQRLLTETYDRGNMVKRALWTLQADMRLVWCARKWLLWADEIVFTGSPPYLVHLLAPLNMILRKRLVYRITDFHPECLMATMQRVPWALRQFHRLTVFWRRRISEFEVLGEDQRARLRDIRIPHARLTLKRDNSPVQFDHASDAAPAPAPLLGKTIMLYSGNWGVAHDTDTFCEGYRAHHQKGNAGVGLWLNAIGGGADKVTNRLQRDDLPVHRSKPVPLEELPNVLLRADVHLITLDDAFVGFVLPSKVYACVASGRCVLFIGSRKSDVHLLCSRALPSECYRQVEVGDVAGVTAALDYFAANIMEIHAAMLGQQAAYGERPRPATVRQDERTPSVPPTMPTPMPSPRHGNRIGRR